MATYVLVHGGWAGGWYWRPVARLLQAAGHEVFTPTLTGIGERVHLAHPDIDLALHIEDVVNVLRYEDLQAVVLVGYSYGGMVITGVAERVPDRLARLVYLDAFVPEDGQSLADLLGPAVMASFEEQARLLGQGWGVPHNPPDADRRTNHPFKTFTQPLTLRSPTASQLPRAFINCTDKADIPPFAPLVRAAARARAEGWAYHELPSGHTPMQTMPQHLADLLLTLA